MLPKTPSPPHTAGLLDSTTPSNRPKERFVPWLHAVDLFILLYATSWALIGMNKFADHYAADKPFESSGIRFGCTVFLGVVLSAISTAIEQAYLRCSTDQKDNSTKQTIELLGSTRPQPSACMLWKSKTAALTSAYAMFSLVCESGALLQEHQLLDAFVARREVGSVGALLGALTLTWVNAGCMPCRDVRKKLLLPFIAPGLAFGLFYNLNLTLTTPKLSWLSACTGALVSTVCNYLIKGESNRKESFFSGANM